MIMNEDELNLDVLDFIFHGFCNSLMYFKEIDLSCMNMIVIYEIEIALDIIFKIK